MTAAEKSRKLAISPHVSAAEIKTEHHVTCGREGSRCWRRVTDVMPNCPRSPGVLKWRTSKDTDEEPGTKPPSDDVSGRVSCLPSFTRSEQNVSKTTPHSVTSYVSSMEPELTQLSTNAGFTSIAYSSALTVPDTSSTNSPLIVRVPAEHWTYDQISNLGYQQNSSTDFMSPWFPLKAPASIDVSPNDLDTSASKLQQSGSIARSKHSTSSAFTSYSQLSLVRNKGAQSDVTSIQAEISF